MTCIAAPSGIIMRGNRRVELVEILRFPASGDRAAELTDVRSAAGRRAPRPKVRNVYFDRRQFRATPIMTAPRSPPAIGSTAPTVIEEVRLATVGMFPGPDVDVDPQGIMGVRVRGAIAGSAAMNVHPKPAANSGPTTRQRHAPRRWDPISLR